MIDVLIKFLLMLILAPIGIFSVIFMVVSIGAAIETWIKERNHEDH